MSSSSDEQQDKVARKRIKLQDEALKESLATSGIYLETVNRHMLDFDFEKLCSVSLSHLNVYACLVCGKYFQGRGKTSHAYFHALEQDHHVFIHLESLEVYVLPDGYQVKDASLNDIKHVLKPMFTRDQVAQLDKQVHVVHDLQNKKYLPGFLGLNNLKANDYVNVILQALIHVKPIRDYFLLNNQRFLSELVHRFNTLVRKMWNPKAFKAQVSPHELLQEISNASQKKYTLGTQSDPAEFLSWFLHSLHLGLTGNKRKAASIIKDVFQGELLIQSQAIESTLRQKKVFNLSKEIKTARVPFFLLTFELPPPPLFQDESEKNIIPQVPLSTLLSKYDGVTNQESGNMLRRYKITQLPRYLIFHYKRFTQNNFKLEKNPTIVNFPIANVDMREYLETPDEVEETVYDLIANICHEGLADGGQYKVHVKNKANHQWYQIQDLFVEEITHEMIFLSESYIQVWERKSK